MSKIMITGGNALAQGFLWFFLLFISLTVHEWAHAFVADKLGDPTPANEGRLSLNPLAHVDFFGTILLPLLCIMFSSGIILGWGKPVPVNARYFKNPALGEMLVGIAGIVGNLLICLVASLLIVFFGKTANLWQQLIFLNAFLIVFNLLPIPPLDGSYILKYLFKISEELYLALSQWGFLIILLLLQLSVIQNIFIGIVRGLCNLFFHFAFWLRHLF